MIDYLVATDTEVFLWLNSWHTLFWDIFMRMATGKWIWIAFYASILFALYKAYGWRTMLVFGIICGIAVTITDQLTASIMRPYFERMRPSNPENPISDMVHVVDNYRGGSFGFPSSHAANTFAVATVLSLVFKRWYLTVAMYFWAVLNCYSRVYLGVHYPGDLVVGLLIGLIVGLLLFVIGNLINSSFRWCKKIGRNDPYYKGNFFGYLYRYRAADLIILTEALTLLAIFFCDIALIGGMAP